MKKYIVAWDLGATKCAAGLVEYDPATQGFVCQKHVNLKLADTTSLENLIDKIETKMDYSMAEADAICIGAGGHYDGKYLLHANPYPYPMNFADMANVQKWPPFAVIHDYASIVCATFTDYMEHPKNIKRLNDCPIKQQGRRVALGIGTGLGLKDGVLFSNGDFWLGQNEMGHIGIVTPPSADKKHLDRHHEIIRFLKQPVTFEKILSGRGTANLYQFLYPSERTITPEEVGEKLRKGEAKELLDTFAWYLGLFVGTVQLTFMPEGGVWITGGVALNHLDVFDRPDFFAGINASPAYLSQREEYPLGVLLNPEHALIGSGYYAVLRLLG